MPVRSLVVVLVIAAAAASLQAEVTITRAVTSTSPIHGFWYDDYVGAYVVYDRWFFETTDVSFSLAGEDTLRVFVEVPAGTYLKIDNPCSMFVTASLYHDHWDNDFTWPPPLGGSMSLVGSGQPSVSWVDPVAESNGGDHRQFQWIASTAASASSWELTSFELTMDVSGLSDPSKLYQMFHADPNMGVWNDFTFSYETASSVDPGVFTHLVPEPATLVLLTTGALGLLRRKRA